MSILDGRISVEPVQDRVPEVIRDAYGSFRIALGGGLGFAGGGPPGSGPGEELRE